MYSQLVGDTLMNAKKPSQHAEAKSETTDNESDLGKNPKSRSTTLPLELDTQIVAICKLFGYPSISEFLREAARDKVRQYVMQLAQKNVWDAIGGPLLERVQNLSDRKTAVLEDSVAELQKEFSSLTEETKLDLPDEEEDKSDLEF